MKNPRKIIQYFGSILLTLAFSPFSKNGFAAIPGSSANVDVSSMDPYQVTYLDYDTDGDGEIDYRVVGDVDSDGVLEWSDIQTALDGLCNPNGDGKQDSADGKLTDLDGDGAADDPYCGTLHILPEIWLSPVFLLFDTLVKDHDQIYLRNYQGLWLRGSGSGQTVLRARYTRSTFCHTHHESGCGGICSRHSAGYLRISGFSFDGLPARTWGDKNDCDGDGRPYYQDSDYSVRTLQTGLVIANISPKFAKNVVVQDVEILRADYNGFFFSQIDNLTLSDLTVLDAGGAGIWMTGVRNSYAGNIHVESVDNTIALGGVTITNSTVPSGEPEPLRTENIRFDNLTSRHNHIGMWIAAGGNDGISNVSVTNFSIIEPRDAHGTTSSSWGIRIHDNGCRWDENQDGYASEPCYIRDLTFDTGSVIGSPNYGFDWNPNPGGVDRNSLIRKVRFESNGYAKGGNDSRNVNLSAPGLVFEENTVISDDYNMDGIADVSHVVRVQADNVTVRNNTISGRVSGGSSSLMQVRNSRNVVAESNTLICNLAPGTGCVPVYVWSDVIDYAVRNNTLQGSSSSGSAAILQGANGEISQNTVLDGRVDVYGQGHNVISNKIRTSPSASVPHGLRVWGDGVYLAHNVCEPQIDSAYCVEVRGTNTRLFNNRNLRNLDRTIFDWTGSAIVE